jgi:DNA-binding XRE family transcriptional regulator
MPRKKDVPKSKAPKVAHVVPEWAKKVKAYREESKKTQVEVEKAINATVNTLSLVENGRREFTPTQRHLFFELIGKPEDSSIPTTVRDLVASGSKKAAKPKPAKNSRATKAVIPAKAPKSARVPKTPVEAPVLTSPAASLNEPTAEVAAPLAANVDQPDPGTRKGKKPSTDNGLKVITTYLEKDTKDDVPKPARNGRNKQLIQGAPVHSELAQPSSSKPAEPLTVHSFSPVKEAVLRDIIRILNNQSLSDNQAKRLHGLFTSLAVNALLGE